VNGAAEPRVKEHIPARTAVVVIDHDAVAIPFPVAAARNVVRRDNPIGIVVENNMPCARIEAADNDDVTDVWVRYARIVIANASAIVVPIVIATIVVLIPAFVPAVVVAIALVVVVIPVLVPAPVSAVVVVLRP